MRINVYSQELTKEVTLVSTDTTGPEGEAHTYYGVRMYLASPDILHHTPNDDDRSAITFWVPQNNTFTPGDLAQVFYDMADVILAHYDDSKFPQAHAINCNLITRTGPCSCGLTMTTTS